MLFQDTKKYIEVQNVGLIFREFHIASQEKG